MGLSGGSWHQSQERLTRGTVTSTMRRAAHPSGCARCDASAGCSAMKYESLWGRTFLGMRLGSWLLPSIILILKSNQDLRNRHPTPFTLTPIADMEMLRLLTRNWPVPEIADSNSDGFGDCGNGIGRLQRLLTPNRLSVCRV